jgi:deoxyguanosine kinase
MRIEICGPIGSGKTSLASLLAGGDVRPIYEDFKSNPFWKAFYANPGAHAFETEITFLLQHYHSIKTAEKSLVVCDFSLLQDLAFARMGLVGNELALFERIYEECVSKLKPADLTILITCAPAVLVKRIQARGRQEEALISEEFLQLLTLACQAEFEKKIASRATSLRIPSDEVDFINDEVARREMRNLVYTKLDL